MQELASGAELTIFLEDYQLICADGPANHRRLDFENTLRKQALLVTRRICSAPKNFNQHLYRERLISFSIDSKKASISEGHFELFVNGCIMYMEYVLSCEELILDEALIEEFTATLGTLTSFFVKVAYIEWDRFIGENQLSYVNFLTTLKSIEMFAKLFVKPTMLSTVTFGRFDREMETFEIKNLGELMYHLFEVMANSTEEFSKWAWQHLKNYFSYLNRILFAERMETVLHVAVRQKSGFHDVLRKILKLVADPNAKDHNGRTPLHLLAARCGEDPEKCAVLIKYMVDAGAHLDLAADDGKIVKSILGDIVKEWKDAGMIIDTYYETLTKTVFPLSCLCARVIGLKKIPYDDDRLPLHLQELVSLHSSAQDSMDLS